MAEPSPVSSASIELDLKEIEYVDATDVAAGGMVGRYQLCFELASGGMAKVYLACVEGEGRFEKLVALKRIHPHLADIPEFIEMFLDEARIASRIAHPNVCTVFDFGRAGREHYIAMEYLLGETLGRLSRRVAPEMAPTPQWWALAMRIVSEAAEGLHAAHELTNDAGEKLQVVHRDVSPANVFVTYDGVVKVVDFGVARAAERIHETRAGHVKGQFAYMAPEQARGLDVDRRADVWSLGVILWELLAGERLFARGNDAATLVAVVHGEVRDLRSVRPEIPEAIASIPMRCLSMDPEQRPRTARELSRELDRAARGIGEHVGKIELGELMESVFAEEKARRLRMIGDARTLQRGRVLRASDTAGVSSTGTHSAPSGAPPAVVVAGPALDEGRTDRTEAAAAVASPLRRYGAPVAVVVAVLALAIAVVALVRIGTSRPAEVVTALPVEPSGALAPSGAVEPSGAVAPSGAVEPVDAVEPSGAVEPVDAVDLDFTLEGDVAVAEGDEAVADGDEGTHPEPSAGGSTAVDVGRARSVSPAARPRISARVARAPGMVSVVTPGGWADVFVGSRRVGRSPGRIELPAGRQTLTLRPFGTGAPRYVPVEVPAGGTARVSVRLSP
jgi:hypothetical protein